MARTGRDSAAFARIATQEPRNAVEAPITLWVPRPPDNANARGHSKALNREKKKFWDELTRRMHTRYHVPPAPDVPFARARIEATYLYPDYRYWLDSDNAMRRLKPLADWLVGNGYIAGDTPNKLEWTVPRQDVGKTPELCSVRITLTALAPAGSR